MRYITVPVLLLLATISYAKEPTNVELLKERVTLYHKSGNYDKDIKKIIGNATYCIKNSIVDNIKNNEGKMALVLDIDDTSVHLFKYDDKLTFGISRDEFENIVKKADALPVVPTLDLYNYAASRGVDVFFISGRREILRNVTIKNLKKAGYKNWKGLYLRSVKTKYANSTEFKTATRNLIRSQGYDIIGNIGDQKSDFSDDNIKCEYKLPNPHYFVR